jgi:hypothetical protein
MQELLRELEGVLAMDSKEFNETGVRTETDVVTFDVRPFGTKQGEAIDSYIHEVGMAVKMGVFWLASARRQGINVQIRRV